MSLPTKSEDAFLYGKDWAIQRERTSFPSWDAPGFWGPKCLVPGTCPILKSIKGLVSTNIGFLFGYVIFRSSSTIMHKNEIGNIESGFLTTSYGIVDIRAQTRMEQNHLDKYIYIYLNYIQRFWVYILSNAVSIELHVKFISIDVLVQFHRVPSLSEETAFETTYLSSDEKNIL